MIYAVKTSKSFDDEEHESEHENEHENAFPLEHPWSTALTCKA